MDGQGDHSTVHVGVEALQHRGAYLVQVAGELDLAAGAALREVLIGLGDAGATDVVVDLTNTSFVDSAGLGILLNGMKRLRLGGGLLRLAGCQRQVRDLLTLTSLDRVMPCYATVEEALADHLLQDSVASEPTPDADARRQPDSRRPE